MSLNQVLGALPPILQVKIGPCTRIFEFYDAILPFDSDLNPTARKLALGKVVYCGGGKNAGGGGAFTLYR